MKKHILITLTTLFRYPLKTINNFLVFSFLIITMTNCARLSKSGGPASEDDFPAPPVAAVKPDTLKEFGKVRIDNYFWMKDRSNPDVMHYLKAENSYCDTVMSHTADLQELLYK